MSENPCAAKSASMPLLSAKGRRMSPERFFEKWVPIVIMEPDKKMQIRKEYFADLRAVARFIAYSR